MIQPTYSDLSLDLALEMSAPDDDTMAMHRRLQGRISSQMTEMSLFREMADRFDALYFTTRFTDWGADLWPDDPSATTPGRSHISINTPSVYVDIPAALQAIDPIENMLATKDEKGARTAAQALERIRKAWKVEEKWRVKRAKAATLKALYGKTASFVYYDKDEGRACADVVENPRNLWIGFKDNDYVDVEWAALSRLVDPSALMEQYSVDVTVRSAPDGSIVPWVIGIGDAIGQLPHQELTYGPARVEVWDYWYRVPGRMGKRGQKTQMVTWNVVVAGNQIVAGPYQYKEYEGMIPYLPLRNTYVPNTPEGRSELHDMEQLIREKMTRITQGAQMIAKATAGDWWQLVGPEAPKTLGSGSAAKPKLNEVALPGPGNRIEAIAPFVAQFQLEQYLGRIDREMATMSGVNDLLLGLAPSSALNSSKAINAFIAAFETRIQMRRLLYYEWDRDTWNLVVKVWKKYDKTLQLVLKAGGGVLDIIDPSLSPRDEMETATRAANLVAAKIWSQARAMDAVGVDDPEQEKNIIREESTDATLWPDRVEVMAQLMSVIKSLGLPTPGGVEQQAQGQQKSASAQLAAALGAGTPDNTTGSQGAETQGQTPPVEGQGGPGGAPAPFAQAQGDQQYQTPQLQSMVQGGNDRVRLSTRTPIPPQNPIGRR